MSLSRKAIAVLLALAVVMFALAACGDDDEDSGDSSVAETTTTEATTEETTETGGGAAEGGGDEGEAGGGAEAGGVGQSVDIEADASSLAFTTGELETTAGEVTINFDNPADIGHDVRIEDSGGNDIGGTEVITNDTATATVTLEPGDYTYFCSVPGHRPGGMEGELTAK